MLRVRNELAAKRRKARHYGVQALYKWHMIGGDPGEIVLEFCDEYDFVNVVAGPERIREFEKILVENPELKLEIERINDTFDSIKKEFDNLPKEELSDEQKESLLSRNKIINTSPTTFSKISRWTGISAAAACFIGMGIIGFDSLKNNTKQESLTDSADERSSEMPPQSLGKIDEQKTALKDTNIQRLSLESEAILENDSEAKENKNRSFNRSLAKKQSIAVPQPAASIAAGSINIDNGGLGAVEAKQKVESGLRYSSNASSAKRLGRSARQEKLNFEYSEEIQLGADDFSEIELSKQA